jgi:phosphoglycerol transferase
VLADEAMYLLPTLFGYTPENYAQWQILPPIPVPAFYSLYSLAAGSAPYIAAKTLNAALVAASALPAFLLAKRFLSPSRAAVFAGLVIATPFCAYARLFMPECLYFFGFWWTIYLLFAFLPGNLIAAAIVSGVALGLLSLVKPHALALVLGTSMFLALRNGRHGRRALAVVSAVAAFYVARVVVGFGLTGTVNLSLTGAAYAGVLLGGLPAPATVVSYALGHVSAVALLVGIPLAAIVVSLLRGLRSTPNREDILDDLLLLVPCLLAALLAMTVYFSCSVHLINPVSEPDTRLHGRYYVFALPLVILAYAALLDSQQLSKVLLNRVTVVACTVVMLLASVLLVIRYPGSHIDFPDLAVVRLRWASPLIVGAALASLVVASIWPASAGGKRASWLRHLPLIWWAGIVIATTPLLLGAPLAGKLAPNAVDQAMNNEVAKALRGRDDGLVIGSSETAVDTYRVMFHLASRSGGRLVDPTAPVDQTTLPAGVRWLILMPGVAYSGSGSQTRVVPLTFVDLR